MLFNSAARLYRYAITPLAYLRIVRVYAARVERDYTTFVRVYPFWRTPD